MNIAWETWRMESPAKDNRLPPRLRRASDFRRVVRDGIHHRHAFLRLAVREALAEESGGGPGSGRVGFVVSDHAVKGAVRRNRVRRLLKEAVRKWWSVLKPGNDIVLLVSRPPEHDHSDYVEGVFLRLLLKAGIVMGEARHACGARLDAISREFGNMAGRER